ncbi:hypothetical protein ACPV5V_29505, partial [Vibrio campbellii]
MLVGLVSATALLGCSQTEKVAIPTSSLPGGMTLVEESLPSTDGKDIKIPYAKYRLNNGLTVVLSPDNSDPLVHVDVTYHVGSAREEVGKS